MRGLPYLRGIPLLNLYPTAYGLPRRCTPTETQLLSKFTKCEQIAKVDEELGLVFGWGIVCKINGEEFFDSQGDHIPEDAMLEAVTEFAKTDRVAGDMHVFHDGTVVHEFPLTDDIAKAFGITTDRTGWMVAVEPSPEVLQKFKDGTYTGFSIGGEYIENEPVTE